MKSRAKRERPLMNAAPEAAANSLFLKIARSSIGAAARDSMNTNSGSSTAATIRLTITVGLVQPDSPPFEMPSTRPVRPRTNTLVPSRSSRRSGSGLASSCRISPAQMLPAMPSGTLNQETHRGHHRVRAHRQAELTAREGVGDDRGGVGEQERAADALQDSPEDQLGAAAREARAERGERKCQEAAHVGLLAAEEVREPPRGEHQHGGGDHVDEDHPDELEQAGAKAALEVRQGDDQRARVDRREQHAEARARQSPPLVVRVLRVDADPGARTGAGCLRYEGHSVSYVNVR